MKKIVLLTLIISIFITNSFGQKKKSEYRYLCFKTFLSHNVSFQASDNKYVMIKSPNGDMVKQADVPFAYTPGGGISLVYNLDFKRDKGGFVFGISAENFGFKNYYKTEQENYKVTNQYRAYQVSVPIFFKYGFKNIYKEQSYFTFGMQFNYFFMPKNFQTASWNNQKYIAKLPSEEVKKTSFAVVLGYNHNVFFINFQYGFGSFVDAQYTQKTSEGNVKPYEHLNPFNRLLIQTGVNIPMNRWFTSKNWTAEKIRRFLNKSE